MVMMGGVLYLVGWTPVFFFSFFFFFFSLLRRRNPPAPPPQIRPTSGVAWTISLVFDRGNMKRQLGEQGQDFDA